MVIDGSSEGRRDIVLSLARRQEIARDDLRSLMNQLVKCVLSVRARFSPDDWSSLDVNGLAIAIDVFSIGFHVSLLEIGSKSMHVLVIRENRQRFCIEKAGVVAGKRALV